MTDEKEKKQPAEQGALFKQKIKKRQLNAAAVEKRQVIADLVEKMVTFPGDKGPIKIAREGEFGRKDSN